MKRLMPNSLITFLQNSKTCFKADLFQVALPNGAVINATEGQRDITVPSGTPGWTGATTTFYAIKNGVWKRGPITSEATTAAKSNTMSLEVLVQQDTLYPGVNIGVVAAALNRLFDAATVTVYTAYMPIGRYGYGDVRAGIETKFLGTITRPTGYTRNSVAFECADPTYLLNMKVPTRLMQSNCPWSFCDPSTCGLTAADYTVGFTAASGSTGSSLTPTVAFTQADGYFAQGVVKCLTGANAGLSQTVKTHASGKIVPTVPWLMPVQPGDTFSVIKGCDKTLSTCKAVKKTNGTTTNNAGRFGGTPFTPVPSASI